MLQQFLSNIRDCSLFADGEKVLLAVSGGRDSVVLAHLMHASGISFAIAHCNFHLRPGDCDRDEAFVRTLASQYQCPIHVAQFPTAEHASAHHLSIEEAARQLRYDFFAGLMRSHGYSSLATGHHRDDAVETFFLNLLRGTGIAGLHGIRPVAEVPLSDGTASGLRLVRPLLPFGRDQIDQYVRLHGLSYVEDGTNASTDYRRNQIRHQLMPMLRSMAPHIDETMQGTIARLSDVEQIYRDRIDELRQRHVESLGGTCRLSIEVVRHLQPQVTTLFELLHPYGFNAVQIEELLRGLEHPGSVGQIYLSASHRLLVDRTYIMWQPIHVEEEIPHLGLSLLERDEVSDFRATDSCAFFDAKALRQPLSLRHPLPGDRFQPYGMNGATRLISDFLKDARLSRFQKERQLILVDADDSILWVVGLRTAHHARIVASTKQLLRVEVQ